MGAEGAAGPEGNPTARGPPRPAGGQLCLSGRSDEKAVLNAVVVKWKPTYILSMGGREYPES